MKLDYAIRNVLLSATVVCGTTCGAFAQLHSADSFMPPHRSRQASMRAAPRLLTREGGRLDWNQGSIAFDKISNRGTKDRRYDVYTMRPDGSDIQCLTCDRHVMGLPSGIVGQPAWHPSGRYVVVQVEKAVHPKVIVWAVLSPGAGVYHDLWLIDVATRKAHLIHSIPTNKHFGVLHPHFSSDGTKLSWSEMYQGVSLAKGAGMGFWKLKVASYVDGPNPHLTDIRDYQPELPGFYENHGFSPDGRLLIFTHNTRRGDPFKTNNIYTMDIATGKIAQQLTDTGYNEHAVFSPDGSKIAWMSSTGNGPSFSAGTDFWVMNADGSNKRRLTFFNDRTNPQWLRKHAIASDLTWNPDGTQIAGYVQVVKIPYEERIYLVPVGD